LKAVPMETYDPQKNTTELRQGSRRTENLRALYIGLALIVVAFIVIYFVFFNQPTTVTTS
jgi:flagellar biosynthesis/type III secretory pathway M-ring protein FliF/YscJ